MPQSWESTLARWTGAGLLEPETAARIRAWESGRTAGGLRWPVRLALGLGALLLAAGVLLFVAAHWDTLSPTRRFGIVLATIAIFHGGGALSDRWPALALALHACGTIALGGGIFLAGQIFHLQEHWPGGLMLWAIGALAGWALRRDWAQGGLVALLVPAWLAAEWMVATERPGGGGASIMALGLLGVALAYLAAEPSERPDRSGLRRTLCWIGGVGIVPSAIFLALAAGRWDGRPGSLPWPLVALGWLGAVGIPVAAAWKLRGRQGWPVVAGLLWAAWPVLLGELDGPGPYLWLATLALGLAAWGVLERRAERVNLGIAGFALTLIAFYFSSVMDKLGRSVSLIGLGLLFLGGGYLLERARRRLLRGVRAAA